MEAAADGGASKSWAQLVNDLKGRVLSEIRCASEPGEQVVGLERLQVIQALTRVPYERSRRGCAATLLSRNMAEGIAVGRKSRR